MPLRILRPLASIALVFLAGISFAGDNRLVISTGEFSPWTDSQSEHSGFTNRVIREALNRQGYSVEFRYWPWKRALEIARSGKVDATSFWYISAENKRDFLYSQAISEHKEVFFYLKQNNIPNWEKLEDLKELRIGATRGFTYTEAFWRLHKAGVLDVEEVDNDELNFKKLLRGRIHIFPAEEHVGWVELRHQIEKPETLVATLTKPLANQLGHLLFPKVNEKSDVLVKAFNNGLQSMKDDGTFKKFKEELFKGIY